MQSKRTELEHEALTSSLRVQLKFFQQKCRLDDIIDVELQQFKKYLNFKLARATYDEAQVKAVGEWEPMRRVIVAEVLRNFDNQEKQTNGFKVWGWSPLFDIFKLWPVPNVVEGHGEHTEQKGSIFQNILIENVKNEPSSLKSECPHIIRVFKHIFQNVHGCSRPLAHSERGLTIEYINSVTSDKQYAAMFTIAATFLENMGWTLYHSHNIGNSSFESMHIDIVNLLGLDVDLQQTIVRKIDFFF